MSAKQERKYLYKVHRTSSQGSVVVLEQVQLAWVEGGLHSSSRFRFCPAYHNVDVDDLLGLDFFSKRISDILRICANFCSPVSVSLAKTSDDLVAISRMLNTLNSKS